MLELKELIQNLIQSLVIGNHCHTRNKKNMKNNQLDFQEVANRKSSISKASKRIRENFKRLNKN